MAVTTQRTEPWLDTTVLRWAGGRRTGSIPLVARVVAVLGGSALLATVLLVAGGPVDATTLARRVSGLVLTAAGMALLAVARDAGTRWSDHVAGRLGGGLLLLGCTAAVLSDVWRLVDPASGGWLALLPLSAAALHLALDPVGGPASRWWAVALACSASVLLLPLLLASGAQAWRPVQLGVCALALASVAWRCRSARTVPGDYRQPLALGALLLAVAPAVGALGLTGEVWSVLKATSALAAAAVLVLVGWRWAGTSAHRERRRTDDLALGLAGRDDAVLQLRSQIHDARSLAAGLRSAGQVLHRPGLTPQLRETLHGAFADELDRLLELLDSGRPGPGRCRLDEVLTPLVTAWRAQGLDVRYDARPLRASASSTTVAGILHNLVDNVRVHAPGSVVRVLSQQVLDQVVLSVVDDGPGLTAVDGDPLGPGVRRSDSPGDGLGLPSAVELARAAGGELRLVDSERGTWVTVRLPAEAA